MPLKIDGFQLYTFEEWLARKATPTRLLPEAEQRSIYQDELQQDLADLKRYDALLCAFAKVSERSDHG